MNIGTVEKIDRNSAVKAGLFSGRGTARLEAAPFQSRLRVTAGRGTTERGVLPGCEKMQG